MTYHFINCERFILFHFISKLYFNNVPSPYPLLRGDVNSSEVPQMAEPELTDALWQALAEAVAMDLIDPHWLGSKSIEIN